MKQTAPIDLIEFMSLNREAMEAATQMLQQLPRTILSHLLPDSPVATADITLSDEELSASLEPLGQEVFWQTPPSDRNGGQSHDDYFPQQPESFADRRYQVRLREGMLGRLGSRLGLTRSRLTFLQRHKPKNTYQHQLWLYHCGDALKRHLEGSYPGFPPPLLWQLSAARAWGDPNFVLELHTRIHDFFWQRVPIEPGKRPMPHLHPRTIWCLLALVRPSLNTSLAPALRERLAQLSAVASNLVLAPQWAGFWDQWLMLRALAAHSLQTKVQTRLMKALAALPLASLGTSDKPAPATDNHPSPQPIKAAPPAQAAPNWQSTMPDWYKGWHEMLINPKPRVVQT